VIQDWYAWTFAGVMAASFVAAGAAFVVSRDRLGRLPIEHAAAAALVGVAGWEILIDLPGSLSQFFAIGAGIANAPLTAIQVFMVANTAFAAASIVAVAGILRRTLWGTVLGVGVSTTRVTVGVLSFVSLLTLESGGSMPDGMLGTLAATTALRTVPSVAAAVLLVLPFVRARRAQPPAATDDVIDLDPDLELDDARQLIAPSS
jgi:hypothetical protein